MTNKLFDFGFTLVNEEELEAVSHANDDLASATAGANQTQQRLDQ